MKPYPTMTITLPDCVNGDVEIEVEYDWPDEAWRLIGYMGEPVCTFTRATVLTAAYWLRSVPPGPSSLVFTSPGGWELRQVGREGEDENLWAIYSATGIGVGVTVATLEAFAVLMERGGKFVAGNTPGMRG